MALTVASRARETYPVFVSSGADANPLRDRLQRLIERAFNSQLITLDEPFRLECVRWEEYAGQRTRTGHTNDLFVAGALRSHLVVVLLLDKLGVGTREEILSALDEDGIELAVIQFGPTMSPELAEFLKEHEEDFLYQRVADPDSDEAWHELIKVLVKLVLNLGHQHFGALYDQI